MKMTKILCIILLIPCLCLTGACSSGHAADGNTEANSASDTNYPNESAFQFEVSRESFDIKKGEMLKIDCGLKNISDEDYHIEHGAEAITYSYNGFGEAIDSIAVLEQFKSNSEISRTLNIRADYSGTVTVTASIDIKPSKHSDQYKTYTFKKDIAVHIIH